VPVAQRHLNLARKGVSNVPEEKSRTAQGSDGKSWAEWKQDLSEAIEELDKACAKARQVVYQLRPLVRSRREGSR